MTHPAILETIEAFGETTLIVDPAKIVELCGCIKENQNLIPGGKAAGNHVRLSAITAVDWHPAEPRFEIVYHLHALDEKGTAPHTRLRIKCRISGANPEIDSVTSVWRAANWYEREVWDMFGVKFRNHPDHVRILMPIDWEGHPLRKDYPVHGYKYSYMND